MAKLPDHSLHNVSTSDIVDEFGSLNELKKDLEKRLEVLRAAILERVSVAHEATDFTVTVAKSKRTGLDTERIRSVMGDLWIASHSKTSDVTTVTARRRGASKKAA